jgi:hypothetical protein
MLGVELAEQTTRQMQVEAAVLVALVVRVLRPQEEQGLAGAVLAAQRRRMLLLRASI